VKSLAILGASGHGKVVAETAELLGWSSICFFDDAYPDKSEHSKWQVIGNTSDLIANHKAYDGVHVAIGDNRTRQVKTLCLKENEVTITSIIHPKAEVSASSIIGDGTAVFANVVVNAQVKIGEGAILNTSCSIDHDSVIGAYSHVSPHVGVAGHIVLGQRSWLGIGSTVIQCIAIGADTVIGAGSVVLQDIPANTIAVGVPCKVIRGS
jgi:sugar O-acyltransferase (sialic acid O-acetyltransferase NeuD family)